MAKSDKCNMDILKQIDRSRVVNITEEDLNEFICGICLGIFTDPVITKCCGQTYCKNCIEKWLCDQSVTCPNCRKILEKNDLILAPKTIKNLLSNLKIKCDYELEGCPQVIKMAVLGQHLKECEFRPNQKCSKCGQIQKSVQTHQCPSASDLELIQMKQAYQYLLNENSRLINEKKAQDEMIAGIRKQMSDNFHQTVDNLKSELSGCMSSQQKQGRPNCKICGLNLIGGNRGHSCIRQLIKELKSVHGEKIVLLQSEKLSLEKGIFELNEVLANLEHLLQGEEKINSQLNMVVANLKSQLNNVTKENKKQLELNNELKKEHADQLKLLKSEKVSMDNRIFELEGKLDDMEYINQVKETKNNQLIYEVDNLKVQLSNVSRENKKQGENSKQAISNRNRQKTYTEFKKKLAEDVETIIALNKIIKGKNEQEKEQDRLIFEKYMSLCNTEAELEKFKYKYETAKIQLNVTNEKLQEFTELYETLLTKIKEDGEQKLKDYKQSVVSSLKSILDREELQDQKISPHIWVCTNCELAKSSNHSCIDTLLKEMKRIQDEKIGDLKKVVKQKDQGLKTAENIIKDLKEENNNLRS